MCYFLFIKHLCALLRTANLSDVSSGRLVFAFFILSLIYVFCSNFEAAWDFCEAFSLSKTKKL